MSSVTQDFEDGLQCSTLCLRERVKYTLFSHTYSVTPCTVHEIMPSTLMYFGSRRGSFW